ncbi:protein TILLER ANGLE CONTROL 1 [Argentina anserina]|uniref:protein TILLER ANGLE CONTROL 1 n=1 Tax=Argentina anserina TaxID=57926 RepID=UPI0021765479|nr:protein TILLER ANGLE CONTROL 1 [Potentilla anserina]
MKIFNWVQKRFHHMIPKDGVAGNGEKTERVSNTDQDTQAFLRQVSLVEGLDHGWRDGILTIGTFGFDPLKPFNNQNDYTVLESEEDGKECQELTHGGDDCDNDADTDNLEYEEMNPLMFTTFGHSFEDMGSNSEAIVAEPDVILAIKGSNEITTEPDHDSESDLMKSKGERITLADLFMADGHDFQSQLNSCKVQLQPELMKEKMNTRTKNGGMAFAKKLIPRVKDDSTPIKNVQRLMRRMLKRKIHPADLDVKKPTTAVELTSTNIETDASESVSLLPIQGATSVH